MVRFFSEWYTRKFSDPQAVTLLVILVSSFLFVYFFSDLLMPVFVALAIAFLLDLPVNRLKALGLSRTMSVTIVVSAFVGFSLVTLLGLMPLVWQQGSNLLQELPTMISEVKIYLLALPEKYPEIIQASQIETIISATRDKFIEWGRLFYKYHSTLFPTWLP